MAEVQIDSENSATRGADSWWHRVIFGRRPGWTLVRVVVLVGVTVILFKFLFIPIRVVGNSMAPTYRDGAIKLVSRHSYRKTPPRRGDVVAIRLPGTRVMEVKRIIALPGERIYVRAGIVTINGEPLDEPYIKTRVAWVVPEQTLGDDDYFVVGDNRRISDFGPVPLERIVGKVRL